MGRILGSTRRYSEDGNVALDRVAGKPRERGTNQTGGVNALGCARILHSPRLRLRTRYSRSVKPPSSSKAGQNTILNPEYEYRYR